MPPKQAALPLFPLGSNSETDLKPFNSIPSTNEQTAPPDLGISLLNTNCQKSQKQSFFSSCYVSSYVTKVQVSTLLI